MKLSMYSRGGSIYKKSDSSGLVFLEKDWNGGRLPRDLIEEFGLIDSHRQPVCRLMHVACSDES